VIDVLLVGLGGGLAIGATLALYRHELLLPAVGLLLAIGGPLWLWVRVHPAAGIAGGLVVVETVYESHEAGLLDGRIAQLRTGWHRLRADVRRGRETLQQRVESSD
jgi:hypothetical protein